MARDSRLEPESAGSVSGVLARELDGAEPGELAVRSETMSSWERCKTGLVAAFVCGILPRELWTLTRSIDGTCARKAVAKVETIVQKSVSQIVRVRHGGNNPHTDREHLQPDAKRY